MEKFDLIICGVGGQGVILASNIVSEVALAAGYDVKKTDTMGMAQRGGSVVSHVRLGREVHSPLIKAGEADVLVAFEKLEAARWSHFLGPKMVAVVNDYALPPLSVGLGGGVYPTDETVKASLYRATDRVYFIKGTDCVTEMGNVRTLNNFLMGCVSLFLPLKIRVWQDVITRHVPPGAEKINAAAFSRGRKEMRRVCL